MAISFPLSELISWISLLFINYVFGDAILAGIFGFLLLIVIGIKMGLGLDSFVVLLVYGGTMFSLFIFQVDLSLTFIIAMAIGIFAMGMLRLMRR